MTVTNLVRCLHCGLPLPAEDAWRVDVKQTEHGEHWGWAHPGCADAIARVATALTGERS